MVGRGGKNVDSKATLMCMSSSPVHSRETLILSKIISFPHSFLSEPSVAELLGFCMRRGNRSVAVFSSVIFCLSVFTQESSVIQHSIAFGSLLTFEGGVRSLVVDMSPF